MVRPTETSEPVGKTPRITVPTSDSPTKLDPEMFFGQPRRLRLVAQDDAMIRVIQKPWGTNYEVEAWRHPLTPYCRMGTKFLPRHPKPGLFGYRNWRGVIFQTETGLRPAVLEQYLGHSEGARCSRVVAGWAMDNMKPRDFLWSEQPVFPLAEEEEDRAAAAVEAAEQAGYAVAACVRNGVGEGAVTSGSVRGKRSSRRLRANLKKCWKRCRQASLSLRGRGLRYCEKQRYRSSTARSRGNWRTSGKRGVARPLRRDPN